MPISSASATDIVVPSASQTVTTGTNVASVAVAINGIRNGVMLVLDVASAATDGTDTLDVTVQTSLEGAPGAQTWFDVCHFTQVAGNATVPDQIVTKIVGAAAVTMFTYATLTAGNKKDICGDYWRVRYSVVSGNSASFKFSVSAIPF